MHTDVSAGAGGMTAQQAAVKAGELEFTSPALT